MTPFPRFFRIHNVLPALALLVLPTGLARAAVLISYTSGTSPGSPGAGSDPVTQGWTKNVPFVPSPAASAFSDGEQGWRTVDSTGLTASFYYRNLTQSETAGMSTAGYSLATRVKFDSDLLNNGSGPAADDYFLPPNQARLNGVFLRLYTEEFGILGNFNVDADSNLFFNDGTTNHQLTSDSSAYDNYKELVIQSYGGSTPTLTMGAVSVPLADRGPQASNQVIFGTTQPGQGSAVWSFVQVVNYNVPEPATGSLVALGWGVAMRLSRRKRAGTAGSTESKGPVRSRRMSSSSRSRRF
jgi:hypothetical protein